MEVISADVARRLSLVVDDFEPSDETSAPCIARITLNNASDVDLDSQAVAPLRLSYHWRDASTGDVVVWDGLRTDLHPPVGAGSRCSYQLKVMTPAHPGCYYFHPSIVQEQVMWLDDLASISAVPTPVNVDRRVWWQPGDTDVLFSPHEILNKQRLKKYLTHPGGFRPIALFCETVNLCNNSCIICAYDQQTRPKGTMSMELFDKVLNEYSAMGGGHLSFTPVVGDALLDRHLVERVRRCQDFPAIRSLSFTTNAAIADLLNDEDLAYVLSRLRRINISVYGLNESEYRTMTRRDTYQRLIRGIERILRLARNEIAFGFRLLIRREPEEAYRWLEKLDGYRDCKATVLLSPPVYSYSNWGVFDISSNLPADAKWHEIPSQKDQCLIPLLACQVFWDGRVSFCPCDDYDSAESLHLGSLSESSLAELYNGERARRLWNWRLHGVPEFCKKCSFYKPLTRLETVGDIFDDPLILAGA
ncbi:MAG TPA: radical SAM/SPASM domain-containing protein [Bryobacteraceae bacterium]|jgi:sulfatase maturation enzyme AslB (radical SAM superfamily)|nr:radical SAM/SPASM domain-containing protein [Bryobacteraceae bacterium]